MKTNIKTLLAVILVFLSTSCTKENTQSKSLIQTFNDNNKQSTAHYIGESYGGGVIFWLDSTGLHGLIAATEDVSVGIKWNNGVNFRVGGTESKIGSGRNNTRRIILKQGRGNYAAILCARYKSGGYSDWFLPSKNELQELCLQQNLVGNFYTGYYWSSTEYPQDGAWTKVFKSCNSYVLVKSDPLNVRAIRAF